MFTTNTMRSIPEIQSYIFFLNPSYDQPRTFELRSPSFEALLKLELDESITNLVLSELIVPNLE